jgi:hypothetical protein
MQDSRPENRSSYHNPYFGGARLVVGAGGGCTSSIGWHKGSQRWGVVAAHCLPNQSNYSSGAFSTSDQDWVQGIEIDVSAGPSTTYFSYGGHIDQAIV